MDEPRTPAPEEPPLERAATAARVHWVRLLRRLGIGAAWAGGIAVLLVVLAILGLAWFSRRPEGGRVTVGLANRALARVSNLRLSAERTILLEHGLRLVRPGVSVVDSAGTAHRLLEADQAIVRTSWWRVIRGTPEVFEIDLANPRFTLRRGRDGRLVLPSFRPSTREPSPLARTTVRLKLEGGDVRLERDDGGLDTLARGLVLNGHAEQRGKRWAIALDRLTGVLPGADLKLHRVDFDASYDEGRLEVPHFQARTSEGWVAGDARGSIVPRVDLAGNLEAGEWEWKRVALWTRQPELDIPGGFAGGFAFRVRRDTVDVEDGAFDVRWREEPLHVAAAGRWTGGRLALRQAALDWRDTSFRGRAELSTRQGEGWEVEGEVAHLDLSTLPRLWPMPALDRSSIDGRFRLAGNGGDLAGEIEEAHGSWRGVPFGDLVATWTMEGRTQTLDAEAHLAGGTASARGTIEPDALDLEATAQDVRGEALPDSWWRELGLDHAPAGRIESMSAHVRGDPSSPFVTGTAEIAEAAYDPVTLGRATVDFDGRLGGGEDLEIAARAYDLKAAFARADTTELLVVVGSDRIEVPHFVASRGDSVLRLTGGARRAGGGWDVTLDSLAWRIGAEFDIRADGEMRAHVEPDGAVRIDQARIVSGAGTLSATGTWGGRGRPSDLSLVLDSLDVASLVAPFTDEDAQARGRLTGRARMQGTGDAAVWTLDLGGTDLRWRAFTAPRLVARGRFAGATWQVETLELDTGRGSLSFRGDLAWASPPDLGGGTAAWNRALTDARAWNGVLVADSLALDPIASWVPALGGWRGALDATFTLAGRPADPTFGVQGTLHEPGWGQATLGDFAVDLSYEDEIVRVNRFAMEGPDTVGPAVRGTLPLRLGWGVSAEERLPDRPMDLALFARGLDLSLVPLVLPQIAAAGGRFDLDARLTGTPKRPVVEGDMTVRDGVVRPASREEVLTGVNGRFVLRGDRLEIVSLAARQGEEGTWVVRPGGFGTIRNLRLETYALEVDVNGGAAFSSGEYVIVLDGNFRIVNGLDLGGPLPLPHLTGRVRVREGVFLYNFADPSRQLATQGPLKAPPWTYVIDVEAPNNVWYRPADANIEAGLTDFQVIQEADQFLMLGNVEALRGRYYFLANGFEIETGTLTFDAVRPNDPVIDARLTTEKVFSVAGTSETAGRETITLSVTGRASRPNVTLSSAPSALSQTEIVTLLTYGTLEAGGQALVSAGSQYLVRQLTREFPELTEYFGEVELGQRVSEENLANDIEAQTYTTVNLTRYFTRDLLVRYSQVVGDVSQSSAVDYQDLTAEYRLNRLLILSGQVTRRRGVLITTSQDRTIYNLDVRARHEY